MENLLQESQNLTFDIFFKSGLVITYYTKQQYIIQIEESTGLVSYPSIKSNGEMIHGFNELDHEELDLIQYISEIEFTTKESFLYKIEFYCLQKIYNLSLDTDIDFSNLKESVKGQQKFDL